MCGQPAGAGVGELEDATHALQGGVDNGQAQAGAGYSADNPAADPDYVPAESASEG